MTDDEKAQEPLLKIGAFAKLAGTNMRTLRYYEEIGLLLPTMRTDGGSRYYHTGDLHRFSMVQRLQELGLPLERIGELVLAGDDSRSSKSFLRAVRGALTEQERILAERAASIREQQEGIAVALEKLGDCDQCRHRPELKNHQCEPCPVDGAPLPPDLSALFNS